MDTLVSVKPTATRMTALSVGQRLRGAGVGRIPLPQTPLNLSLRRVRPHVLVARENPTLLVMLQQRGYCFTKGVICFASQNQQQSQRLPSRPASLEGRAVDRERDIKASATPTLHHIACFLTFFRDRSKMTMGLGFVEVCIGIVRDVHTTRSLAFPYLHFLREKLVLVAGGW